jgi:phage shock protein PspC (stress-responsive transcriptional regulator)
MNNVRRLYRSTTNKVLGGVCYGMGTYFNMDPTIVRLLWVLFTLLGGAGILAYIICWIVIPEE